MGEIAAAIADDNERIWICFKMIGANKEDEAGLWCQ